MNPPDGDKGNCNHTPDVTPAYGALLQLAIHGQENKWWMLYIFLMFNSILLLSCATLFAVQQFGTAHRVLLWMFAAAGAFIDACWIPMAADYVKASDLYGDEVVEAEKLLPATSPKPLTKRAAQRVDKGSLGTSKFIAITIPVVLILLYVVIAVLTCQHP